MNWHTEIWSDDGEMGLSISRTDIHLEFHLLSGVEPSHNPYQWERMFEGLDEFHYRLYLGPLRTRELQAFLRRTLGIVNEEAREERDKERKKERGKE